MKITEEDSEEFPVINYFEDSYQEYWREQMLRTNWPLAQELVSILEAGTFFEKFGTEATLKMLCDGESLISYAAKDSTGQVKYLFTSPSYRGNGCAKKIMAM